MKVRVMKMTTYSLVWPWKRLRKMRQAWLNGDSTVTTEYQKKSSLYSASIFFSVQYRNLLVGDHVLRFTEVTIRKKAIAFSRSRKSKLDKTQLMWQREFCSCQAPKERRNFAKRRPQVLVFKEASWMARYLGLNAQATLDKVASCLQNERQKKILHCPWPKAWVSTASSLLLKHWNNWTELRVPYLHMAMGTYEPHSNLKPMNRFLTLLSAETSIHFVNCSSEKVHLPRWTNSVLSCSGCVSGPTKQLHPW